MKTSNSVVGLPMLIWFVIAVVALFIIGVASAQAAILPNQITVRDQDLSTSIAVIDSVTASQESWVVLYKAPDFTFENLVGYAPVHEGLNQGVKVVVSLPKINHAPMLWAVLQADNGTPGVFEWGLKGRAYNDAPITVDGKVSMAQFATSAASLPAFLTTVSGGASPSKPMAAHITLQNQDLASGIILVDEVTIPQDGWIVFYRNPNLTSGEIVGYAPVYQGTNTNVKVTIDTVKAGDAPVLWAQLHTDGGKLGVFEWGYQNTLMNDWPLIQDNQYVRASFSTSGEAAPTATTQGNVNHITIQNQDLGTGIVTAGPIVAAQNGWVVIYRDPDFGSGDIVGFAPVYKGTNMGVKITIDTTKVGDRPLLWAVLHTDGGLQNVFEWGYQGRDFADPPVFENGQYVSAAFGTSGP